MALYAVVPYLALLGNKLVPLDRAVGMLGKP
jgi:hypothetical protein